MVVGAFLSGHPFGRAALRPRFAADVLDKVAAPNLALQFDACHARRISVDVLAIWAEHGACAAEYNPAALTTAGLVQMVQQT